MLKSLKTTVEESKFTHAVLDSTRSIWLAGLGAFAMAQEEGGKMFESLVKAGEKIEARTLKATDATLVGLKGRATGTWDRLEQAFEDRVSRSLETVGVPTMKEIDALSKRVTELSASVNKLAGARVTKAKGSKAHAAKAA
jgi:poly(hydroxyalkanoate) granule-associated protein